MPAAGGPPSLPWIPPLKTPTPSASSGKITLPESPQSPLLPVGRLGTQGWGLQGRGQGTGLSCFWEGGGRGGGGKRRACKRGRTHCRRAVFCLGSDTRVHAVIWH